MIPLDLWNSEEMRKRRENAYAKAMKENPSVEQIQISASAQPDGTTRTYGKVFKVKDTYTVEVVRDADDQYFTECNCAASMPPINEQTGLPSREPQPCYHVASVLLFIAEKEKEADGTVN